MKMTKIVAAAAMSLLLWGCLLTPGKFDSAMDVRRDGTFSYRYSGELVLLTAAAAMKAAADMENQEFDPATHTCWEEPKAQKKSKKTRQSDEESVLMDIGEPRECTAEELEEARKDWEAGRAARAASKESETAMAKAMLGGLDPTDPKTMDEFARRLQAYKGWKRVVHKGDGVFDVQFETSGRLDHGFVFPLFPEVDHILQFVQASRRADGAVRIVAPAFVQSKEGAFGMSAMMAGMGAGAGAAGGEGKPPMFRQPEGTFTLTTDAEILTNNTNDGPATQGGSKVLRWTIGPLDDKKPEALLKL